SAVGGQGTSVGGAQFAGPRPNATCSCPSEERAVADQSVTLARKAATGIVRNKRRIVSSLIFRGVGDISGPRESPTHRPWLEASRPDRQLRLLVFVSTHVLTESQRRKWPG